MKMKSIASVLSALIFGQVAMAADGPEGKVMERGVYYTLSEPLARHLNLDYSAIKAQANLKAGENLVVKMNEQSNELNVEIFDNAQFAAARADIMQ